MMTRESVTTTLGFAVGVVSVVAAVLALGMYSSFFTPSAGGGTTQASSTLTTGSVIQGVVTGYVTVGPAQPVCSANQSCDVNMSGYSLVFTPQCPEPSSCQVLMAELSPAGHYSILLPPGNYTVTGLRPSCAWMGCPSAFPRTVSVEGGMQLVFNVDIDTGIR